MTQDEFDSLHEGDIVRHRTEHRPYMVHANYGNRVTAVQIADLTQPNEWDLVFKAEHKRIND